MLQGARRIRNPLLQVRGLLGRNIIANCRSYRTSASAYAALRAEPPTEFWMKQAAAIDWFKPPSKTLDSSNKPFYRWFPDGELNMCYNALDRHLPHRAEQTAIAYDSAVVSATRKFEPVPLAAA